MLKTLLLVVLFGVATAHGGAAQTVQTDATTTTPPVSAAPPASVAPPAKVVRRGAPIGDSLRVKFADALQAPLQYADKSVVIEGVVKRVCQMEGCWMEIAPGPTAQSVRVTFKNHGFFVPKNADGQQFRAEGRFSVKHLDRATVAHLVKEDGAKIKPNPDGTADEVTFVATGVELWP